MPNYQSNLFSHLEQEGFTVGYWKDLYNDMNECSPNEAKELLISNFEAGIVGEVVKLPKAKEITVDWIMNKLNKESTFINIAEQCKTLVPGYGVAVYPTSYGIGVSRIFGEPRKAIERIESLLQENGLQYSNEYSEAMYVYRFKISKSQENLSRLKAITNATK